MRLPIKFFAVVFIVAISTASCSDFLTKDNEKPDLNIQSSQATDNVTTFNGDTLVFKPGETLETYPPFTSTVNDNQIVINGYYLAASKGIEPTGEISQDGQKLQININYDPSKAPLDIPAGYFYDAYISNLESGTYSINIIHKSDLMRDSVYTEHTVFSKEFVIE